MSSPLPPWGKDSKVVIAACKELIRRMEALDEQDEDKADG